METMMNLIMAVLENELDLYRIILTTEVTMTFKKILIFKEMIIIIITNHYIRNIQKMMMILIQNGIKKVHLQF